MKKILCMILTLLIALSTLSPFAAIAEEGIKLPDMPTKKTFVDVPSNAWYKDAVEYVTKKKIFEGTEKLGVGTYRFSPEMSLTRAQFVMIFANLEKVNTDNTDVESGFADVPQGKWYTAAVKWAAENGLVAGDGTGNFKPEDKITREQMCVLLYEYVTKFCKKTFIKNNEDKVFADADKISNWAKEAVTACHLSGLISGTGTGSFAPQMTADRAQGAQLFADFDKNVNIYK